MFLERSFYTVAVYVRWMKSTSNPPGVWKRILPFFWGSLHHCQLFWRKNQEKAGVSGWTTPWPSSGASLHYGQWAGVGDSHGKEHRGTRDESQGLLIVQSQPKLVRKNVFFTAWGFTSEIPWDTPTWINLADRKIGAQANQLSHCVQTRQLDWADGSTFMQQMPDIVVAAAFLLYLCRFAPWHNQMSEKRMQWLFLRMCCMKACLGSVRRVQPLGVLSTMFSFFFCEKNLSIQTAAKYIPGLPHLS